MTLPVTAAETSVDHPADNVQFHVGVKDSTMPRGGRRRPSVSTPVRDDRGGPSAAG